LQDTPPRTETGVQPVPIGMLSDEMSTPRRPARIVSRARPTEFEFLTFWQHCAAPVGGGGGEGDGSDEGFGEHLCEMGVVDGEGAGAGAGARRCGLAELRRRV
jgi:hypothetical protein